MAFAVVCCGAEYLSLSGCGAKHRSEDWDRLRARYSSTPATQSDFEQRIMNFSRFASEYPGTAEALAAEQEIRHLRVLETAAKANEFGAIEAHARKLLAEGMYLSARDCLERASFWPPTSPEFDPLRQEIEACRQRTEKKAVEDFKKLLEDAKKGK